MNQNQQLYHYLYQTITSQIFNGTFIHGQDFPSQREICLRYNVGITTVRKVMKLLAEEGYIIQHRASRLLWLIVHLRKPLPRIWLRAGMKLLMHIGDWDY